MFEMVEFPIHKSAFISAARRINAILELILTLIGQKMLLSLLRSLMDIFLSMKRVIPYSLLTKCMFFSVSLPSFMMIYHGEPTN